MAASWRRTIGQGVVAGLMGFVVIAVANVIAGRSPFHASALPGATLFHGATHAAQVAVTPASVLADTGLHVGVSHAF